MLTQAFNEQVDFQTEAQAVLREKTLEHEQHHFNHTLKSHDFVIPKNAATGIADGGKLSFKKDEKFRKIFDHIMHMQQLMADIEAGFGRMNDILDEMEKETASLEKITGFLRNDDIEGAKEYAESLGIDTSEWDKEQTKDWLIQKGYEHIDNIEKLTKQWKIEAQNIKDNIEKLRANGASPEQIQAAQDKLDGLEDKFEKVAQNQGLIEEFKTYDAHNEVNAIYSVSEKAKTKVAENTANKDTENRNEFKNEIAKTANTDKLAEENLSTTQAPSLSKMAKFLKPKFNEVAPNKVAATLEDKKELSRHSTDENNIAGNSKIEDIESGLSAASANLKLG